MKWRGGCDGRLFFHFGGCNPGKLAHRLKRNAASAWRAFSSMASCSAPGGSSKALWRALFAKAARRSVKE